MVVADSGTCGNERSHRFWPTGVPLADSVDAFIIALSSLGFVPCNDAGIAANLEKIALYAINGRVKHASGQMANGRWRSKMGKSVDIEHELEAVEGPFYGQLAAILQRRSG
jgi:hypothetical protein